MIRPVLSKILMVLSVLAPFAANVARADASDESAFDHTSNQSFGYCSQYYDPNQCAADRNCKYDYVYRSCIDAIPGGGRSCSSYDRDPQLCNAQPNCQFDYQWNRCSDQWQQPGGSYCSRWDNDPFTCNNAAGCGFDTWQRRCVANGGGNPGNPGGQVLTTTINCSSGNFGTQTCPVYGSVIDAYLVNQTSFGNCQQGSTWGYNQNGVWVSNGCSGNFQVRYYPR